MSAIGVWLGFPLIIAGAWFIWQVVSIRRIERERRGPENPCDCNICRERGKE